MILSSALCLALVCQIYEPPGPLAPAGAPPPNLVAPVGPARSSADERHFGDSGQFFIRGASALTMGGEHLSALDSSADTFSLKLETTMGGFASRVLAVGGGFNLGLSAATATQVTFGLGPVLALRAPISDTLSFFPGLYFPFALSYSSVSGQSVLLYGIRPALNLDFVVELFPGLSLALGPSLGFAILSASAGGGSTSVVGLTYGVNLGLVAWR